MHGSVGIGNSLSYYSPSSVLVINLGGTKVRVALQYGNPSRHWLKQRGVVRHLKIR